MSDKLVLIVEDERLTARLLAWLAEECGVRAEVAYNGRKALERMRARKPDLVLLDLIMPVMNGEEVLAAMEADPDLADVPVVVISTRAAIAPGAGREIPHLRKPFEPVDVKRFIREHLVATGAPMAAAAE